MFDISKIDVQTGTRGENYRPLFNTMVLDTENQALVTLATPGFNKDNFTMRVVHYQTGTALEITGKNTFASDLAYTKVFGKNNSESCIDAIEKGITGTYDKPVSVKIMVTHDDHYTKVDFKVDYVDGLFVIKITETQLAGKVGGDELKFEGEPKKEAEKTTTSGNDRFDQLMNKYFSNEKQDWNSDSAWKYGRGYMSPYDPVVDVFSDFSKDFSKVFDDFWGIHRRK